MLYMINHGAVSYGANTILTNINFEINAGQKIAVVGRNGCGKTTLLKLIEGEVELEKRDSDEDIYIAKSGNPVIGYLKQIAFADETISMETEVRKVFEPYREKQRELEAQRQIMESDPSELNIRIYTQMQEQFTDMGGYYYEKEYETMLRKFGFTEADKKKPLREFSGGQQTKLGFIKMLLSKPDILLLDEPTNHLDIETIEWLENYLKASNSDEGNKNTDMLNHMADTYFRLEKYDQSIATYNQVLKLDEKNGKAVEGLLANYTKKNDVNNINSILRKYENAGMEELMSLAKEFGAPYELVKYVHENGKLPVVNFAASGIATPADAALMMQLGSEGVFVGSGIFKSGDPAKRARAIVQAVTYYNDPVKLAELSENLGEAMSGLEIKTLENKYAERGW